MLTRAGRDLLARVPLILIWINQLVRTLQSGRVADVLMAASTAIGLVFLLRRRIAVSVDYTVAAWAAAIGGTALPMFLHPGGTPLSPDAFTASLAVAGVLVTTAGILALGHSFGIVAANRGVVSSGIYRWVRHPLYAGYFITQAAFCIANPTTANLLIWIAGDVAQLIRIGYEERLLARDTVYQDYQTRVPWRLLPGVF